MLSARQSHAPLTPFTAVLLLRFYGEQSQNNINRINELCACARSEPSATRIHRRTRRRGGLAAGGGMGATGRAQKVHSTAPFWPGFGRVPAGLQRANAHGRALARMPRQGCRKAAGAFPGRRYTRAARRGRRARRVPTDASIEAWSVPPRTCAVALPGLSPFLPQER
jgi:hypothetical protein